MVDPFPETVRRDKGNMDKGSRLHGDFLLDASGKIMLYKSIEANRTIRRIARYQIFALAMMPVGKERMLPAMPVQEFHRQHTDA